MTKIVVSADVHHICGKNIHAQSSSHLYVQLTSSGDDILYEQIASSSSSSSYEGSHDLVFIDKDSVDDG